MEKSIFEELGGSYSEVNGYQMPNLMIAEAPAIGKWGRLRKRYLQEQHPLIYSELLLTEKLYPNLAEIDEACRGRLELIVHQMSVREGVTEALKAADQMEWVRRMNSIRARAEEIVLHELIYTEEAQDADS